MHIMLNFKKRKIALICGLFTLIIGTIGSAYGVYVLANEQEEKLVNVDPENITISERTQNFISYNSVSQNIISYDNDILDDTFSISLSFNQGNYNRLGMQSSEIALNSGIGIEVFFSSSSLYQYVRDNIAYSFVDFSYNNQVALKMEHDGYNLKDGVSNYTFVDTNKSCYFSVPFDYENCASSNTFYLQKIAEDQNLASGSRARNFLLNLNFDLVDESVGYSRNFNKTIFGNVSVRLVFEMYDW